MTTMLPTGVAPLQDSDFRQESVVSDKKTHLGQMLFFDKILSGNKNIACATCHHPAHGTGDGLALPIGEGGIGLGPKRRVDHKQPVLDRVPRNSPHLYFAGAKSIHTMFHDGRVTRDKQGKYKSGFISPAGAQLPTGLENVLAVQAMFPVLSDREMAGQKGENKIANNSAREKKGWQRRGWHIIAKRLQAIPEYVDLFKAVYPEIQNKRDITYVHAANAIAAFEANAFRADQSPFDKFIRTKNADVLTTAAKRGMDLFYGRAGCSSCHTGPLQTDQKFYAIAMPQIGPGKGHGKNDGYKLKTGFKVRVEDEGRYAVTHKKEDLFKFRTPSLRNVEITGPWGHAGAYNSLEAVIRHHADPVLWLKAYNVTQNPLPKMNAIVVETRRGSSIKLRRIKKAKLENFQLRDSWVQTTPALRDRIGAANELKKTELSNSDVQNLIAFLKALTDPRSRNQGYLVPNRVPSGLPVQD